LEEALELLLLSLMLLGLASFTILAGLALVLVALLALLVVPALLVLVLVSGLVGGAGRVRLALRRRVVVLRIRTRRDQRSCREEKRAHEGFAIHAGDPGDPESADQSFGPPFDNELQDRYDCYDLSQMSHQMPHTWRLSAVAGLATMTAVACSAASCVGTDDLTSTS